METDGDGDEHKTTKTMRGSEHRCGVRLPPAEGSSVPTTAAGKASHLLLASSVSRLELVTVSEFKVTTCS